VLEATDILFIDSSHVVATGGDVCVEFLEIIPRLRPGVVVHVHDIFLPGEYPRAFLLDQHYFWTEQYLLHAFLSFNTTYSVLWAAAYMSLKHPAELKKAFASYEPGRVRPGSFWIQRLS
jgi:hypothetical protein